MATLLRRALARARSGDRTLGASALELAIISAILVTAAVLIAGVVYRVVEDKGSKIEDCSNQPVGAAGC